MCNWIEELITRVYKVDLKVTFKDDKMLYIRKGTTDSTRYLIDINGTSTDEINRIFDAVYTEESQFNTKMQNVCEQLENVSDALKKLADSIG